MDIFSQIALNQGLTFLAYASGIVIIVVAGFLVKLLIDLSKLSKNLTETSSILNKELKPTLESVSETLKTINELVKTTDQGVGSVKNALEKVFSKTKEVGGTVFGGLLKGFLAILGLFSKK